MFFDHRNAFFDALKKTKVDVDFLVINFFELVANLYTELTCNMLSFQDSKLPSEDVIEKNLGLYICVNIEGIPIKKDLI